MLKVRNKAEDNDIVATSSVMSLKCPLSTLRITTPCRSTVCTHNQCFDALSFLQLQQQAPTWTCPVCNKIVSFEALEIDQYVDEILKSTPKTVEQVNIEPNGDWSRIAQGDQTSGTSGPTDSEDDEDLIEIQDLSRVATIKGEAGQFQPLVSGTPLAYSPRNQSTSSTMPRSSSHAKRPIDQVIDLTFSSDDDDDPVSKRPATKNNTNSYLSNSEVSPALSNASLPQTNRLSFSLPKTTSAQITNDYRHGKP